MSSSTYSACLIPESRLRRLVYRSGVGFTLLGVALIGYLPYEPWQLSMGILLWIALHAWQLRRLRRGWRCCRRIRVLPGPAIEVESPRGDWLPAELESGSFVIGRVAWLRLITAEGVAIAELLLRSTRRCNNWRRLQVIWRHIGAT